MTHTIKSLYDAGQRQFYMRGGGVSPKLFIYGHYFQAIDDKSQGGRPFKCLAWKFDGTNYDDFHALDLLPIPYTDPASQLERVKVATKLTQELWEERQELYYARSNPNWKDTPNFAETKSLLAVESELEKALQALAQAIRGGE